jgi:hypothetical protein
MFHTIEFSAEIFADLETSPRDPLKRVRIPKGTRVKAEIKPYVVEGKKHPIEVADLFFSDGSATRRIPFKYLCLVD